ncbi:MAG: hypothetical protein IKE75_02430 [Bacilli bacterium]|nr:hypothetical protein [Bacilli bacterium]
MKKIMYSILILCIIIFNTSTKAFKAKNIDLKINDDETSVVFIKLEGSTSLLINDENDSNLFIINYKNDENLKDAVKIFKSHPNIFYLNKNTDKIIDNIHVLKQNNTLKFRINNYTLCIGSENINICDFIYIININRPFEVNENIKNVFYDENIDQKYLKNLEESWIDTTIVSKNSFTILKLTEENYNILVVPSTNE